MFETSALTATDKAGQYAELAAQLHGLLHGETDLVANAANFAALVYHALPELNWCGLYFVRDAGNGDDDDELVLGPFQGRPACVRIAFGRGVCGTAAATRTTQLVPDVHAYPGHIACDSASRSEIVVPLVRGDGTLLGVWDVDSPRAARFDEDDRAGMQALCAIFLQACAV